MRPSVAHPMRETGAVHRWAHRLIGEDAAWQSEEGPDASCSIFWPDRCRGLYPGVPVVRQGAHQRLTMTWLE